MYRERETYMKVRIEIKTNVCAFICIIVSAILSLWFWSIFFFFFGFLFFYKEVIY